MRSRLFYGLMIYKCGKSVDINMSYPHSFLLMHIFLGGKIKIEKISI